MADEIYMLRNMVIEQEETNHSIEDLKTYALKI